MSQAPIVPEDLTRRERRKLEVRNRIIEAAMRLFDERGYADTKVAMVCDAADIAHKTFFNHFPTKQDLLRSIAALSLDSLLADIEESRKVPGTIRDRIVFFFDRIADNCDAAGPMHREIMTEIVHVAHETNSETEQARKLHAAFGAIIADGRREGSVTDQHAAETLTDILMGAFYALMFNWANLPDYPVRAQAGASAKFLADAIGVDPNG